jgi:hypothetical protein
MRKTTPFRVDKTGITCVKEINSAYVKKSVDIVNMTVGISEHMLILPSLIFEQGFCQPLDSDNADVQAGYLLNTPKKYPIYYRLDEMRYMLEYRGQYKDSVWVNDKIYFYAPIDVDTERKRIYWGSTIEKPNTATEQWLYWIVKSCQERAMKRFIEAKIQ